MPRCRSCWLLPPVAALTSAASIDAALRTSGAVVLVAAAVPAGVATAVRSAPCWYGTVLLVYPPVYKSGKMYFLLLLPAVAVAAADATTVRY